MTGWKSGYHQNRSILNTNIYFINMNICDLPAEILHQIFIDNIDALKISHCLNHYFNFLTIQEYIAVKDKMTKSITIDEIDLVHPPRLAIIFGDKLNRLFIYIKGEKKLIWSPVRKIPKSNSIKDLLSSNRRKTHIYPDIHTRFRVMYGRDPGFILPLSIPQLPNVIVKYLYAILNSYIIDLIPYDLLKDRIKVISSQKQMTYMTDQCKQIFPLLEQYIALFKSDS